jgi:hypothetical protein
MVNIEDGLKRKLARVKDVFEFMGLLEELSEKMEPTENRRHLTFPMLNLDCSREIGWASGMTTFSQKRRKVTIGKAVERVLLNASDLKSDGTPCSSFETGPSDCLNRSVIDSPFLFWAECKPQAFRGGGSLGFDDNWPFEHLFFFGAVVGPASWADPDAE